MCCFEPAVRWRVCFACHTKPTTPLHKHIQTHDCKHTNPQKTTDPPGRAAAALLRAGRRHFRRRHGRRRRRAPEGALLGREAPLRCSCKGRQNICPPPLSRAQFSRGPAPLVPFLNLPRCAPPAPFSNRPSRLNPNQPNKQTAHQRPRRPQLRDHDQGDRRGRPLLQPRLCAQGHALARQLPPFQRGVAGVCLDRRRGRDAAGVRDERAGRRRLPADAGAGRVHAGVADAAGARAQRVMVMMPI